MSKNKEIGNKGEQLAVDYLLDQGYQILERNYRFRRAEIDIIGLGDGLIVFFEVKARSYSLYGNPEDTINENQRKQIIRAAERYMETRGWDHKIRFDIIAITLKPAPEILHIEDVFF